MKSIDEIWKELNSTSNNTSKEILKEWGDSIVDECLKQFEYDIIKTKKKVEKIKKKIV